MAFNRKQKLLDNIEAIRIAFMLDKEERAATEQEKAILAIYCGFGGLKCILNPARELTDAMHWAKSDLVLFAPTVELHRLIRENSKDDYGYRQYVDSLKSSVLTAFYTPNEMPKAIVDVLAENGIHPNNMIEPSAVEYLEIIRKLQVKTIKASVISLLNEVVHIKFYHKMKKILIKRDPVLDILKGIGIFMVVMGHTTKGFSSHWIYLFHMPLFFIASGCLYAIGKGGSVKGKVRSIVRPYFVFSLLSFLYWWLLEMKFRPMDDKLIDNDLLSGLSIPMQQFANIFLAANFDKSFLYNVPLWFLPCLFIAHVIYHWLSNLNVYYEIGGVFY